MSKTKDRIHYVKLGAEFRARRVSKGLKASWVAVQMGVSPSCLCLLETGKRDWTEEQSKKFLKAIGEL